MNFIRKVYLILSFQLLMTSGFVVASCKYESYRQFMAEKTYVMIIAVILNLCSLYALVYIRSLARNVPWNYLLLTVFTATESYLVSSVTAYYDPQSVLIAAVLTTAIVVALTIYACTTKTDFTMMGGLLFMGLMALIVASILGIFIRNRIFQIIISSFSVLLFGIYLIYDTQLILGNGELKLTQDDYIFAAMNLYIDIIQIFINILQLLGNSR